MPRPRQGALAENVEHVIRGRLSLYPIGRVMAARQIYRGRCPFHVFTKGESPSLIISATHNTFACMVCLKIGTVYQLGEFIDEFLPLKPLHVGKSVKATTHPGGSKDIQKCPFCSQQIPGHKTCNLCRILIHLPGKADSRDAQLGAATFSQDGVTCDLCIEYRKGP